VFLVDKKFVYISLHSFSHETQQLLCVIILVSCVKVKMCLVQFVVRSFQEITSVVGS